MFPSLGYVANRFQPLETEDNWGKQVLSNRTELMSLLCSAYSLVLFTGCPPKMLPGVEINRLLVWQRDEGDSSKAT